MSHHKLLFTSLLTANFLAVAPAQTASSSIQQQLIAADRSIWQAIAGAQPNIPEVGSALAPDYIDMELAVSHSRAQVLKDLETVKNFSFHYENARAFVLSPTSGYVIADLSYSSTVDGKASAGRVLTTTVFNQEHGHWLAHLHTEMDVKPADKTIKTADAR